MLAASPRLTGMKIDAAGLHGAVLGVRNDAAQSIAGRLAPAVPFADLGFKVRSKAGELFNALVHRRQMSPRQVQHVGARRASGATQLQDFADFAEGEAERLGFLDQA